MKNVKESKRKKIAGAVLSSIAFSFIYIVIFIGMSFFQFTESEKMPWLMYIVISAIFLIPVIFILVNLIARIREIIGGEEDEASKY